MSSWFSRQKDEDRAPRYIVTQKYADPELGVVSVTVRANARRFTSRWNGRILNVTVPPRTTAAQYAEAMAAMKPAILKKRPAPRYKEGVPFGQPDFSITIERDLRLKPRLMAVSRDRRILLGADIDLADPQCEKAVSRLVRTLAARAFDDIIMPRAVALAAKVGVSPRSVSCSTGRIRLGVCNSKGEIRLSCLLVLLPPDLRDYVILHEFAHLTEMNHSERFYALLDRYCGGRNVELRRALMHCDLPE